MLTLMNNTIVYLEEVIKKKESDNYVIRSINHEMYLQEVRKTTISAFDKERCFLNEFESTPWN